MNEWDDLERRLDELVRPGLVLEPPAAVRATILAAVLRATEVTPAALPLHAVVAGLPSRTVVSAPHSRTWAGLSPVGYAAVAALIAAYVALVGLLGGIGGTWDWVPVVVQQLRTAAALVVGLSVDGLSQMVFEQLRDLVPWLALTPILWLQWERDRVALRGR